MYEPLDANYRRVRRLDDLGRIRVLPTVVDASSCASLLLYVLLYGVDAYIRRLPVALPAILGVAPLLPTHFFGGSYGGT